MRKIETKNKWPGIFKILGVKIFDGKNSLCPLCNKNKFEFTDKDGSGSWTCQNCGDGKGVDLITRKYTVTDKEAFEEIEEIIDSVQPGVFPDEKPVSREYLRELFTISKEICNGDFVMAYLKELGINIYPATLRTAPKVYNAEKKSELPAMLTVVTNSQDVAVTMLVTYLTMYGDKADVQKPVKIIPCSQSVKGCYVRLFEPREKTIGIAPCVETALYCTEKTGINTWAAVGGIEHFIPPKGIKTIMIFGDNTSDYLGQKNAYTLANRLCIDYNISVLVPFKRGTFLDYIESRELKIQM